MMIDVHGHASVPAAAALAQSSPGFEAQLAANSSRYRDPQTAAYMNRITPEWDHRLVAVSERMKMMNATGIASQFVSINPGQYYYWADESLATDLVETVNHHIAGLATDHPSAIVPIATVALQHPNLATEQLRDAMICKGMAGVQISTSAGGRDLSSPEFESLWSAAEETGAMIILHPLGSKELLDRLAPSYLNNIVGQPFESTLAISHLIFSGVLDRHPDLRICSVHGGGYFPHYLGRGDHAWGVRPDSHSMDRKPSEYLDRFWFDSLVHSPAILRALIDVVGADRVVIGTDYPFDMGDEHPDRTLASLDWLLPVDRQLIARENALSLLGRHAGRLV
jgi:aminocarboxymuconate-semialdehyde decarboxylase